MNLYLIVYAFSSEKGNVRHAGQMRPAQVLNVARVRTLLGVQHTDKIENINPF